MQTDDTDLLFQSDDQLKDAAKRAQEGAKYATLGSPIRVTSKILDACIDGNDIYTAESGWQARRVNLNVSLVGSSSSFRCGPPLACTKVTRVL
jgi:hypothetical protein